MIAGLALFLAMGGVSYGLAGSNSVHKDDLAANSVGKSEIRTGAAAKSEVGHDSVGPNEALEDTDKGGGFTGKQIKEDTLGKVPNADKLDDLDSSDFVKGKSVGNVIVRPDGATTGDILTLSGVATIELTACDDNGTANDGATYKVTNGTGASLEVVTAIHEGGNATDVAVAAGGTRSVTVPTGPGGTNLANLDLVGSGRQAQADLAVNLAGAGCKTVARGLSSVD